MDSQWLHWVCLQLVKMISFSL